MLVSGEIWRPIPSLPEYLASSWGRVMRLPFQANMPHGGLRWYGGKPHNGQHHKSDPRPLFMFKRKSHRISRLICEAFHGPEPFLNAVVMHLDDDETNNTANNLQWGTQKENLNTSRFLAFCRSRIGDKSPTVRGRRRKAGLCMDCGTYPADPPSNLCPGCETYREPRQQHTQALTHRLEAMAKLVKPQSP